MSALPLPHITPQEYLEIDRASEVKSEYYDGAMYAMSGGSPVHARISFNVIRELGNGLRGRGCSGYSGDLRVRVDDRTYVFPDVTVVCGELKTAADRKDTALNPTAIVEVLSPSTELNDRGLKFARYRRVESLQEYVLVSQNEPRVEVFRRQPTGQWLLSEFTGLDAICRLESVGCEIALQGIYDAVDFPPDEAPAVE